MDTLTFIPWKTEFEVGVASIDDQHKKLNNIINRLHKNIQDDINPSTLKKVIHELMDYAALHFLHEEVLLKKYAYPDLPKQIQEHRKFVKDISEFEILSHETKSMNQLTDYLTKWWTSHILGEDRKFGPFLNARGVN